MILIEWLIPIFVALWTVFMAVLGFPFFLLAPFSRFTTSFIRVWARVILGLAGTRLEIKGAEHITPGKTFVFIANHQSLFDIPVIFCSSPILPRMVAKKELFSIPFFGWGIRLLRYIPIDRGNHVSAMESLDKAAAQIRSGISVLLFAEGTRSRDGELQSFKKGSFVLALKSGAPIIPVTISGSIAVHHRDRLLRIRTQKKISVTFHAAIDTAGYGIEGRDSLMSDVRNIIETRYQEVKELSKGF
ncbi:MAG: 1-acyl-sn-glycerol-3-phosphate acyltransferase [Spirochaetia bacterium]|nr:1-acyl-sn-glycerol-3-phosphate acyltransferase [Spirochaetia bacterium]